MKDLTETPEEILCSRTDFFGKHLDEEPTLIALQKPPKDVMKACLLATIGVLERQYEAYFTDQFTDQLRNETKPVRSHNMDAEEIMGGHV